MSDLPPASQQQPDPTPPGEDAYPEIPGYGIEGKLGEGAMGAVYKARQISLDRLVAMKTLPPMLARNSSFVTRFQNEAKAAARVKHSGIVQIHEAGSHEGLYYFIMEYIAGQSIGDWLRSEGIFSEEIALVVGGAVGNALKYAWDQANIVHRDIKPDNILLDEDGTIKVADLGLAKVVGSEEWSQTMSGLMMGTPQYCSPEQASGETDIDFRTDIYAMGATLYHMMTGSPPFPDTGGVTAMIKHITEFIEDPMTINPAVSVGAATLIEKMMVKDPTNRYADWGDVVDDVARIRAGGIPARPWPAHGASTVRRCEAREEALQAAEQQGISTDITHTDRRVQKVDLTTMAHRAEALPVADPKKERRLFPTVATALLIGLGLLAGARLWLLHATARREAVERIERAPSRAIQRHLERVEGWPAHIAMMATVMDAAQTHDYEEALQAIETWQSNHLGQAYEARAETEKQRVARIRAILDALQPHLPDTFTVEATGSLIADRQAVDVAALLEKTAPANATLNEAAILISERRYDEAATRLARLKKEGRDITSLQAWMADWRESEEALRIESGLADIRTLTQKTEFKKAQDQLDALWAEFGTTDVLRQYRKKETDQLSAVVKEGLKKQAQIAFEKEQAARLAAFEAQARQAQNKNKLWNAIDIAQKAIENGCDSRTLRAIIAASREGLTSRVMFAPSNNSMTIVEHEGKLMRILDLVWVSALHMWVGQYEVSNFEYKLFKPEHRFSTGLEGEAVDEDAQPVCMVSWNQAREYCTWLREKYKSELSRNFIFRLPTAKEWTTFAQCRRNLRYPWGSQWPPHNDFNYQGEEWTDAREKIAGHNDGFLVSCPVMKSGQNAFGLFGVGGNVWEFCDALDKANHATPVLRGASFREYQSRALEVKYTQAVDPNGTYPQVGFRIVVGPTHAIKSRWAD